MTIIGARKISYWASGVLVLASFLALAVWGLKLGIDFTGGTLMEVEYKTVRPSLDLPDVTVQPAGERGLILRMPAIDEARHQSILAELRKLGELDEKQFTDRKSTRLNSSHSQISYA